MPVATSDRRFGDGEQGIERMLGAFRDACWATPDGCVERWYRFAGAAVQTRIAGSSLAERYQRAFAHLAIPEQPAAAEITVDLWDEAATGIGCPPEWIEATRGAPGTAPRNALSYILGGRVAHALLPGSRTWLDRAAPHIVGWRRQGHRLSLVEQTRPLAPLLSIWLYDRGIYLVHGGLVARHGRGALFAGPSGAGKSTSTLACLDGGFQLLGDDQVALQEEPDGRFTGHSLFATTRVAADHLARFPSLRPYAIAGDDQDDPKSLVQLADVAPRQLAVSTPIAVLLLPIVAPIPRSQLRAATEGEALMRMARSTLLEMTPSLGADGLRLMARLVRRVPAYWLELGRDLGTIPEQVDLLLASLAG